MTKLTITKILLLLIVAVFVTGCSVPAEIDKEDKVNEKEQQDTVNPPANQGITVNKIPFEILGYDALPENIRSQIDSLIFSRGYAYWPGEDGAYTILISSGEKMTGGYGIEVTSVEDNELIDMSLKDDSQAGIGDTVLRIEDGGIDYSQPIIGIYQGQMDNHSIEVLVNDEYMPFSADDIGQFLEGIEIGDKIEIRVSISPSDQIIVESIMKVNE